MSDPRGDAGSASRARRSSASNGVHGWPESGGTRSDHMASTMVSMLWDVLQAVAYTLQPPSRPPRRRGAVDPSVRNSGASRRAAGRAILRQFREATRRHSADRECRSSLPAGAHEGSAAPAAARQCRSRVGMPRPRGFGRYGFGLDGDKAQTACPAPEPARRESRAAIPVRHAFVLEATRLRARQCERRDQPRRTAGNPDRLWLVPTGPAARPSRRPRRPMAARRPAALRSPVCRDRLRKVRPQRDHLRVRGCCGRSIMVRAERRMAVWASAELRRAATPADAQSARKSGLRRTHSHAKPRAFNVSSAR